MAAWFSVQLSLPARSMVQSQTVAPHSLRCRNGYPATFGGGKEKAARCEADYTIMPCALAGSITSQKNLEQILFYSYKN